MHALKQSAGRLKQWCIVQALPYWARHAQRDDKSWVEHLKLDGAADLAAERRWRVLARQVYVYAKSSSLGWHDGAKIAISTYEKMKSVGYVHRVSPAGDITNPMRDLYDHAFYILAASSLYELTQQSQYLEDAETLLSWIDQSLAHPTGGWKESNLASIDDPRRQNPHMHLFEASLFLYGVTRKQNHLQYAEHIYKLFEKYVIDNGTISEFFKADWTLEAGEKGQTAEPGHAMEWIWLLGQYHKATGANIKHHQIQLYHTNGIAGAKDMAAATIDALFPTYLTQIGLWNDQINACGVNIAKTIPVSTFYHILCMAAEANRIANSE